MDAKPEDSSKHRLHGRGGDPAGALGLVHPAPAFRKRHRDERRPIISGAKGRPIGAAEPASATLPAVLRLSTAFFRADRIGLAFMVRSRAVWSCRRFRADRVGLAFMVGAIVLVSLPSCRARS